MSANFTELISFHFISFHFKNEFQIDEAVFDEVGDSRAVLARQDGAAWSVPWTAFGRF